MESMKIFNNCLLTVILFSILQHVQINCQVTDKSSGQAFSFREKLYLTSDRDIYISGEKVLLKIFKTNCSDSTPTDFSKVVYLELLDKLNNPVVQVKISADGTSGSASVSLPDTLSSGNYLLRAYTAWMQNFPEDLFAYRVISVINPFKELSNITASTAYPDPENTTAHNESEETLLSIPVGNSPEIQVRLNKDIYGQREKVILDLSVAHPEGKTVQADLSVSVIKSFLSDNDLNNLIMNSGYESKNLDLSGYPGHLPEPEGVLIQGEIFNKATNEALKETDISLSIVGKKARCQFMKTNSEGGFIFVMKDLSGTVEIVIQPLDPESSGSYVELKNPFCETYKSFAVPSLRIDSACAGLINNAVIAMQVNRIYESEIPEKQADTISELYNFFGNPVRTVRTADYIELTDIREVVKEIIPEVTIFRKDRQPSLKVISSNPYQIFSNKALVLLDGVPVSDIEKLLSISARELERVEIINSRYFYADYVLEGIISFITKKGDLSSPEEDNSFFRQVFEGCSEKEEFRSPVYVSDSALMSRIPDFRNTLFWKPYVTVTEAKPAKIEFYTSDEAAEYIIVTTGFTSQGKRIKSKIPLIVK